ncbi:hypothetical protein QRX50_26870 [Amycolatopsis carbonis]|uniref:Uncharacterized protein n=1 Tax=Amycolatopsis carbonis TaxID=715471 RepID=A0A9Y2I8A3_9PSEU|nr:hypothetical protein [Amycolatopsis sp. 2-15]WIX75164.1 hypothetical protein QRX50_26870 [Amycolatopsis sp. 2-15]
MDGDPDDAFTKALRGRYNDLEAQRQGLVSKLAALSEAATQMSDRPDAEAVSLLDALPCLAVNLAGAPEDLLRALFEVVQLHIQVHDEGERATLTITLPADQLTDVAGTAKRIYDQVEPKQGPAVRPGPLVGFWTVPPVRFELTLDGFRNRPGNPG